MTTARTPISEKLYNCLLETCEFPVSVELNPTYYIHLPPGEPVPQLPAIPDVPTKTGSPHQDVVRNPMDVLTLNPHWQEHHDRLTSRQKVIWSYVEEAFRQAPRMRSRALTRAVANRENNRLTQPTYVEHISNMVRAGLIDNLGSGASLLPPEKKMTFPQVVSFKQKGMFDEHTGSRESA